MMIKTCELYIPTFSINLAWLTHITPKDMHSIPGALDIKILERREAESDTIWHRFENQEALEKKKPWERKGSYDCNWSRK